VILGRHRAIGASALPLILLLAACTSSGGGATVAPSVAAPSTAPSAEASTAAGSPAAGGSAATSESYEIKVAPGSGSVTNYLTGQDGKTLYLFGKDTANSGKSACGAGPCLDNWPPFTVDDKSQLKADSGVTGALDVITRDDGSKQVTYKGLPLYYFAGDQKAGDTNGAAIPNWSVAKP
jgi:predicted lipoprotein with Yx(FWY)xxD motif